MNKSVLGRGLGALIPENSNADIKTDSSRKIIDVALDKIKPNMYQPRQYFNDDKLIELADSIKSKGIINPIIVREETGDSYQIIAGERRWRAASLAGLTKVPVIVQKADNIEMLELAIIENVQRDDLNAVEEAESYQRLLEEFNLTHNEISEKVGKSRAAITNTLRLLKLPYEIKKALRNNEISSGHARALLGAANEGIMNRAFSHIINDGISVRETEDLIRKLNAPGSSEKNPIVKKISPEIKNIENELMNRLGTKVLIKDNNNKGKIIIDYYSIEDFERIMDKIKV